MPVISRFYGITIRMYHYDHAPPHFHVQYAEFRAPLEIATLSVLEGQLPRRALALVRKWATGHCQELRENWRRAERQLPLLPIRPLKQVLSMDIVKRVRALPGYRLQVEYTDGLAGIVDVSDRLWGEVFEPLKDPEFFAKVRVDGGGGVCWPNGADLAPDGKLRTQLEKQVGWTA